MRGLLTSSLAIVVMFSVALAEETGKTSSPSSADLFWLSDDQMDRIKAGSQDCDDGAFACVAVFVEDLVENVNDCRGPNDSCTCLFGRVQITQRSRGGVNEVSDSDGIVVIFE